MLDGTEDSEQVDVDGKLTLQNGNEICMARLLLGKGPALNCRADELLPRAPPVADGQRRHKDPTTNPPFSSHCCA